MTAATIYYLNGSAFCARCNALMLRDYPHPLRFHEPADCTRSSGDADAQEQIVEGLRLVGAGRKMNTSADVLADAEHKGPGSPSSSDQSPTASLEGR